jgi:hypothetical protein
MGQEEIKLFQLPEKQAAKGFRGINQLKSGTHLTEKKKKFWKIGCDSQILHRLIKK